MDSGFTIKILCLFCRAPLEAEETKEFDSGDLIECTTCGELNDYDSVVEVAKEEAINIVKSQVNDKLSKTVKKLFK